MMFRLLNKNKTLIKNIRRNKIVYDTGNPYGKRFHFEFKHVYFV